MCGFRQAYLLRSQCRVPEVRQAGGVGILCRGVEALRELRAAGARGVPCVRRADDGGRAARCGVQAAVGCRGAAVADRRRDAGFDPQGAAAKARREICRAHFRAACRTGGGRVAPDHGDGARTGAEKPRSSHRAARKFVELRGRLLVFPRAGGRLPGRVGEGLRRGAHRRLLAAVLGVPELLQHRVAQRRGCGRPPEVGVRPARGRHPAGRGGLLPCTGIRCVRDLDAGARRGACFVGAAGVPFQAVDIRLRYLAAACP